MIYCSLKGCRKRIDPDLHSRYKNGTERIGKMNLVLDIGILVFLVFFFFLGIRRGAAKTLVHILGTVAAITVSIWLGQYLAQWIYETFFQQQLIQNMSQQIMDTGGTQAQAGIASALSVLPDFVIRLLPNFGIDTSALAQSVQSTADGAAQGIEVVIAPVIVALLSLLVIIVLFLLLSVVVKLVAGAVGKVFQLPVLRSVDAILGAVLGLGQGLLVVALLVFFIKLLVPFLSDAPQVFNAQTVENTFLFRYFYNIIPFGGTLFEPSSAQAFDTAISAGSVQGSHIE